MTIDRVRKVIEKYPEQTAFLVTRKTMESMIEQIDQLRDAVKHAQRLHDRVEPMHRGKKWRKVANTLDTAAKL